MRLEIWIIAVMIFLVAGVLGLIASAPDDVSVPKATQEKVSETLTGKEPTMSMPVPAPGHEDVPEMIVKEEPIAEKFKVELEEKMVVDEIEAEPEQMEAQEPSSPDLVEVDVAVGSGVPGCDETNECYIPYEVSISVGGEVVWNNIDSAAHTVTSGNPTDGPDGVFDSSLFMSGTTFSHTFDEAGTYKYFCMVHPWMKGIIQVS